MIKKGIKNIIFDLGVVLVDLNRELCVDAFKALGIRHVEDLISPFQQSGIFMQYELGGITTAEFRKKIRNESDRTLSDKDIDNAWNSFLVSAPTYRLEALIDLKNKYNLYLLSNTNELHWEWCKANVFDYRGRTVDDFFIRTFLSYEMHEAKPGTAIFQELLNKSGVLPEETFFIDDMPANCETAEILGISTYTPVAGEDWRHLFNY